MTPIVGAALLAFATLASCAPIKNQCTRCDAACDEDGTRACPRSTHGIWKIPCAGSSCDPVSCHGANVVFVLDSSNSIGERNWLTARQYIIDIAKHLSLISDDVDIGLVTFSNSANIWGLGEFTSAQEMEDVLMTQALPGLDDSDNIDIIRNVFKAERRRQKKIAILVSDGQSDMMTDASQALATEGIEVFYFELSGDAIGMTLISSSDPNNILHFTVDSYAHLAIIVRYIVKKTCQDGDTPMNNNESGVETATSSESTSSTSLASESSSSESSSSPLPLVSLSSESSSSSSAATLSSVSLSSESESSPLPLVSLSSESSSTSSATLSSVSLSSESESSPLPLVSLSSESTSSSQVASVSLTSESSSLPLTSASLTSESSSSGSSPTSETSSFETSSETSSSESETSSSESATSETSSWETSSSETFSSQSETSDPMKTTLLRCPEPDAMANADVTVCERQAENERTYSCHTGYSFADSTRTHTITCSEATGAWSITTSSCTIIDCSSGPGLSRGSEDADSPATTTYGTVKTYSCDVGYDHAEGSPTIRTSCTGSGAWAPSTLIPCTVLS